MPASNMLTTAEIRRQNCAKIYRNIYDHQETSKQAVTLELGLSLPTVTQNLKLLEELGLINYDGFYESTGGRKARVIHCVRTARIALGVTILRNRAEVLATDLMLEPVAEKTLEIRFRNEDDYFREIGAFVNDFAESLPYPPSTVLGVGIAIQGLVSEDSERVVYGDVIGTGGITRHDFGKYLNHPCALFHDSDAAADAELFFLEDLDRAVYIALNLNMGGSLIVNHQVIRGNGIIEHMKLVPDGKPCYCGRKGCVETCCSAESLIEESGLPVPEFFRRLRSGDPAMVKIWDRYLNDLALAIDNIRMVIFCPFIIGGQLQDYLIPEDFNQIRRLILENTSIIGSGVELIRGRCGSRAPSLGAARHYIERFLEDVERR